MKFSYRVIALILLALSVVALYIYWDDSWTNTIRSHAIVDEPQERHFTKPNTQTRSQNSKLNIAHSTRSVISNPSECEFANLSKSSTRGESFDTYDIFRKIDDAGPTTRKAKRVDDFRNKKPIEADGPNKLPLKIILVPHSHNDPGWHKTVEGYFQDQTKPTLDNMVEKLAKFPNMTFVWAESVFLHMWYKDLDRQDQLKVRELIKRRQLEIVGGGWVVPDEANPHYFALIDQMIEGHQWLEKTMGVKPQNTWTLDPFGYSSTHPYLYKQAGYENMIILRVHEKLKEHLQKQKALEFYWRQHWAKDDSHDIFTQMMPYRLYNIKHTCGPDHYVCLQFDFRRIPGEYSEARSEPISPANVDRLAKQLIGQYQLKANLFRHNVVLIPLGDDFRYDRPVEWDQQYKNYMMLFNHINKKKEWNVQARFGILQDYFDEVKRTVEGNAALKETGFPSLQGDFFPYTDENNEYWAGYFTTRPFDKNLGREVEVHLRAAEILNTLAQGQASKTGEAFKSFAENMLILPDARQDLGLFQHHDAITGTARSFVVVDYEKRLHGAMTIAKKVMRSSTEYLLKAPSSSFNSAEAKSLRILHPEEQVVDFNEEGKSDVILFNSVAHDREELVHLSVTSDRVDVYDANGKMIPSQINPVWKSFSEMSTTTFELLFYANLPALSLAKYQIVISHAKPSSFPAYVRLHNAAEYTLPASMRFNVMPSGGEHIVLENQAYRTRFSPRSGMLHSITTKGKIMTTEANLEFLMYKSRGSGAYIFMPAGPAIDSEMSSRPTIRVIKGPLASEIHIVQELVQSTFRLCNTTSFPGQAIEIENVVDIRAMDNKELIMRFSTDIKHNGTFYTDLNAFQMMKRKRFHKLPKEANYYPTSSIVYMEDEYSRFNLISAQPLGVSSQSEGALEIMLDRRLQNDDNRGLGEGVWDNKRAPSRFYLLLERKETKTPTSPHFPSLLAHKLANNLRNYVFQMFPTQNTSLRSFKPMTEPVGSQLACDQELTNLRSIDNHSAAVVLHRVGYSCGFPTKGLSCTTSEGTPPPLETMFSLKVNKVQATSLSLMHNTTRPKTLNPMELYAYKIFY